MSFRRLSISIAISSFLLATAACNPIDGINDQLTGPYHHLSGGFADYLRIQQRATYRMVEGYMLCKAWNPDKTDEQCGTIVLQLSRTGIESSVGGVAGAAWGGKYHRGWDDDRGGEFSTAIKDLFNRGHQCLSAEYGFDWLWNGPHWTTVSSDLAECELGNDPCPDGILACDFR